MSDKGQRTSDEKAWGQHHVRMPASLYEKLVAIAEAESKERFEPVSVAAIMRRFIQVGLTQHEKANGGRK